MTINVQFARQGAAATVRQPPIAPGAARLLAAIEDLAPELAARAGEIERVRLIPADITDRLRRIGLFRTLLPRSHGGLELSVPEVLPLIEALSAADSSVGWVAMIGTISQMFSTRAPRETFDKMFRNGADVLVVGVDVPAGRAEPVDGGYRVSGRWPFASGCQNAQWIAGHCVIHKDGAPVISAAGPMTRFVVLPAERWRIKDTWQASGLAGTGSHHVVLDNVSSPRPRLLSCFVDRHTYQGRSREPLRRSSDAFMRPLPPALRPEQSPTSSRWPAAAAASSSPPPISGTRLSSSMNWAGSARGCARRARSCRFRRKAIGIARLQARSTTKRILRKACRATPGSMRPAPTSSAAATRWPDPAPCSKHRRCSGACAIFTPRGSMSSPRNGFTPAPAPTRSASPRSIRSQDNSAA